MKHFVTEPLTQKIFQEEISFGNKIIHCLFIKLLMLIYIFLFQLFRYIFLK